MQPPEAKRRFQRVATDGDNLEQIEASKIREQPVTSTLQT